MKKYISSQITKHFNLRTNLRSFVGNIFLHLHQNNCQNIRTPPVPSYNTTDQPGRSKIGKKLHDTRQPWSGQLHQRLLSLKLNSTETKFKCNHCELFLKNNKGLKIHIGNTHKSFKFKTPEKERRTSVFLTLTLVTEDSKEEVNIPLAESTFNAEGDEVGLSHEFL